MSRLVLGPVLRHVAETEATVWVEVAQPGTVAVHVGADTWSARTFSVHGHHYALVELDGLAPGTSNAYAVSVDEEPVWPPPDSPFPPSRIRTLGSGHRLRMVFGSCRVSVGHDAQTNQSYGVDALRAFAMRMMDTDEAAWPDLVLFLGDQVYADETSTAMQAYIARRRDIAEAPGVEVKDFEEYAHLYVLAWTEPANRWLLSTLPSAMIFDDHDVRDDWNTSARWRSDMAATPWWHERIVGALGSYWVYQHLGNLSASGRADDELWPRVRSAVASGQDDVTELVDAFAARADEHPDVYRWSHARDIGRTRLVVLDSRAARILDDTHRQMADDAEAAWLDEQMRGDLDHLLIGSSLPYLLPMGLHHVEAWNEAVAAGVWGKRAAALGEVIRQGVDLEHWAAFQESFRELAAAVTEVADGRRGHPPATVTFLSGDVHHSYLAEVDGRDGGSRVLQAVCSPIRNPLPPFVRVAQALTSSRVAVATARLLSRLAGVREPPFGWRITRGPWFDNMVATLEADGRELVLRWEAVDGQAGDSQAGDSQAGDSQAEARPRLRTALGVRVGGAANELR